MKTLNHIISAIQEGSKKAEKQLFMATNSRLMAVALRYVVDKSAAEDVLQESYIRIFKKIPSFKYESEAATFAWMCRIATNEAIRWLKRQKRWNDNDVSLNQASLTFTHSLFQDELYHCLLRLTTEQRIVFNMYAIEGYSHQEIAQTLDIAVSSSRSLLTRARKRLAQQFEKKRSLTTTAKESKNKEYEKSRI